jgi:hypothetical protein
MSVASFSGGPRGGYSRRRGGATARDRTVVPRLPPAGDPVGVDVIGDREREKHADRDDEEVDGLAAVLQ